MATVNYLRELEAFIEYAPEAELTANERLVWYALMHIFNQRANGSQWPDGYLAIDNRRLMLYLPISENAMMQARNQLAQHGLLNYVPGRKNSSNPMYQLIMPSTLQRTQSGAEDEISTAYPQAGEDDHAFYRSTCGKAEGKTDGKTRGKPRDIYPKLNQTETETYCDEDEVASRARTEIAGQVLHSYGRMPTPAETERIRQAAVTLDMDSSMVNAAIMRAGVQGAASLAPYVCTLLYNWHTACVHDEMQLGRYEYEQDELRHAERDPAYRPHVTYAQVKAAEDERRRAYRERQGRLNDADG